MHIIFCLVFLLAMLPGPTALAQSREADINDNLKTFLESRSFTELLNQYKQESITLSSPGREARRLAAQPYSMAQGFRCQIFAGASLANAEDIARRLAESQLDTVYVFQEEQLYKVQMGDFQSRTDAEVLLNSLKEAGFPGAWIVESNIRVTKSQEPPDGALTGATVSNSSPGEIQDYYYAVQVFASGDAEKAAQLSRSLQIDIQQPTAVLRQGNIWKVMIGRFSNRAEAEQLLRSLKDRRYTDAWITQVPAE